MAIPSIKLLALDLDGTVLNSRGVIMDENRRAIRAAEEAGVLVTIATGRRFRDARPVGLDLELNAPMISHNGALLKYIDSLETVAASLLDVETTREILRVGKRYGGDALVSADPHGKGTMLYDRISKDNLPLQKYLLWSERLHGSEAEESVKHVSDLHAALPDHQVIHISFSGGCGPMESLLDILRTELAGSVTILPTIYPSLDFTLIDILPPNASKGTGVEKLAAIHGLAAANVMVVGDNFNDLEMLEFAGVPVIMGNADPSLLERGEFYTTLSNDEGGVAAAIDRFIFTGDAY
ncbi:MAG TPA: Cof-type HAD-IIB family hydrolase [Pyrinomonadaceae bacterium]|nr:Cof-type HAD-IIB family hydrolase [Pyrinomonadaceae bacterium]